MVRRRAADYEFEWKPVHAGSNPVPGSKYFLSFVGLRGDLV